MFEVAYFWRLPPATLLVMELEDFERHEKHAERIAQMRKEAQEE